MKKGMYLLAVVLIAAMAIGLGGCKHQHDYVVLDEQEPTCVKDGYRKSRCSGCGDVLEETLYALGHDYNIYNVCTRCDDDLMSRVTVGLNYEESADGKGYYVSIGTTKVTNIVVPAYNEGKPVLGVRDEGFFSPGSDIRPNAAAITGMELPDGLESIGTRAFYGLTNLKTVRLPRASLKSVGDLAFSGCTALSSLGNTSSGVESVGKNAFAGCTSLTSLPAFPYLRTVGEYAFTGCTGIESANFSPYTQTLGNGVFADCTALRFASLGASTTIPKDAFQNCTALEDISLSASLKEICSSAFSFCKALKSIRFGGTMAEWKAVKKADDWFLTDLEPTDFVDFQIYCTDGTLDHFGTEAPAN